MNRAEIAKGLFLENLGKKVTIRMIEAAGVAGYTARNAVAEAKKILPAGYLVRHEYGPPGQVWENGWICEKFEPAPAFGDTTARLCGQCGHVFQARTRDVEVGLGRVCSLVCAGRRGYKNSPASRKNASASQQLEMS